MGGPLWSRVNYTTLQIVFRPKRQPTLLKVNPYDVGFLNHFAYNRVPWTSILKARHLSSPPSVSLVTGHSSGTTNVLKSLTGTEITDYGLELAMQDAFFVLVWSLTRRRQKWAQIKAWPENTDEDKMTGNPQLIAATSDRWQSERNAVVRSDFSETISVVGAIGWEGKRTLDVPLLRQVAK